MPDGTVYVGEFSESLPHGQGLMTLAGEGGMSLTGRVTYEGTFNQGKIEYGTKTFADGGKYVGDFIDSLPDGQGVVTMAEGGGYAGEWKNGKFNGQGTLTLADGRKQVGKFKDNIYQP